jgi:ammonia channel protein AmtB
LKQGEKISKLDNTSQKSYSFTFDHLQKNLEKYFQNILQNKTCGASVVQNVNKKKSHPCALLVSFQATFALTLCKLVQFSTSIFALVCVGINHQIGGD